MVGVFTFSYFPFSYLIDTTVSVSLWGLSMVEPNYPTFTPVPVYPGLVAFLKFAHLLILGAIVCYFVQDVLNFQIQTFGISLCVELRL